MHSRKEYLLCSGDKLTCEACAAYLLQSGIHPEPSQLDRIEKLLSDLRVDQAFAHSHFQGIEEKLDKLLNTPSIYAEDRRNTVK